MKRQITSLLLVFFSAGWLIPFTISIAASYDFTWRVVWPMARDNDAAGLNPFHLFQWSAALLYVSVGWLAVVIAYWVLRATKTP
jgi:hypothetical protein